jgi:hypothetical protein
MSNRTFVIVAGLIAAIILGMVIPNDSSNADPEISIGPECGPGFSFSASFAYHIGCAGSGSGAIVALKPVCRLFGESNIRPKRNCP